MRPVDHQLSQGCLKVSCTVRVLESIKVCGNSGLFSGFSTELNRFLVFQNVENLLQLVEAVVVDREEDPEQAKRYLSSRSTIRIAVMATTNSATKQEMVSVRKKRVNCKVRSGPF